MSDATPPVPQAPTPVEAPVVVAASAAPAPVSPYGAAPVTPPTVTGAARPARVADVVVTIILLAIGFFAIFGSIITAVVLPEAANSGYSSSTGMVAVQVVLVVAPIVLLGAAAAISIPLMLRRRLAFWVPLVAGFVSFVIYWVAFIAGVVSNSSVDPGVISGV